LRSVLGAIADGDTLGGEFVNRQMATSLENQRRERCDACAWC